MVVEIGLTGHRQDMLNWWYSGDELTRSMGCSQHPHIDGWCWRLGEIAMIDSMPAGIDFTGFAKTPGYPRNS